jgi:23S rRNA-/tRNA-specific pseudouridylate synthase
VWFQNHQVKKNYECLALGSPSMPLTKIRKPIEGVLSTTQMEVRESYPNVGSAGAFLARISPLSGKRHQIRIHLSGEGHPILGDTQYGGPKKVALPDGGELPIERVALHAARLALPNGEQFEAPWPEDFKCWVEVLRKGQ